MNIKNHTNKIKSCFEKTNNNAFIAYITAGDDSIQYTVESALALLESNIDLLELGLPFTDPIADGPIIQEAHYRALNNNFKTDDFLICLEKIRKYNKKPIILMGYANPIMQIINNKKLENFKNSGLDGLLTVDMVPLFNNKNNIYHQSCDKSKISPIYIITPNTQDSRLEIILDQAQSTDNPGFIYYAIRSGVTGFKNNKNNKNNKIPDHIIKHIKYIKNKTKLPIAAGFGIKDKTMAQQILNSADGFISGSYFVQAIKNKVSPETLQKMAQELDPR